ncbi:hypothetical protein QUA13_29490, partial [Microcoleus sp. S28C3]|uniref:DUF5615 family PIN-like protein n=1 Tax=Microcoleus sp. S28C3 TaxID=3055414 RepID=UPI002FD5F5CA
FVIHIIKLIFSFILPRTIALSQEVYRCFVTLDRGFGNRLRYNPSDYSGIVVLRLPSQAQPQDLQAAVEILIRGLDAAEVAGKLWIIRREQLLEYQAISSDESD